MPNLFNSVGHFFQNLIPASTINAVNPPYDQQGASIPSTPPATPAPTQAPTQDSFGANSLSLSPKLLPTANAQATTQPVPAPAYYSTATPQGALSGMPANSAVSPIPQVPQQYQGAVYEASRHTGIPVTNLANQFLAENGGNWSPTLPGIKDPKDFGMTQMNPSGVDAITGADGSGHNYFKENYGHEFDLKNPTDQILGAGVYLNRLKQFDLPSFGIKNPTLTDVQTSYNTGAQGYTEALKGDPGEQNAVKLYQANLRAHKAIQ